MIVAVDLPQAIAQAVALEAARYGQSPASWIIDRLADRFGLRDPSTATVVPLFDPITERRR